MEIKKPSRVWVAAAVVAFVLTVFVFNDSFRATLSRKRAIKATVVELAQVTKEVETMRRQVAQVESNPHLREQLVRKELGYLRPGEKEVRFLKTARQ